MYVLLYRYSPNLELCDIHVELFKTIAQAQNRICNVAKEWAAKHKVNLRFDDSEELDEKMYTRRQKGKPYMEFDISRVEMPTAVF